MTCCAVLVIIIIDNRKRIVKAKGKNTGRNIPGHFKRSELREESIQKRGANEWERDTPTEYSKERTDAKSTMKKNWNGATAAELKT